MDKHGKKSFTWLNITQFLGALNDNVFQMLVIFFLTAMLGADKDNDLQATIMSLATIFFVAPFLLFSHAAGVLADRFSKSRIIIFAKFLEILVMTGGLFAIIHAGPLSQWIMYGMVFLMCTQSSIFGPSKLGIIRELVGKDKLSSANGFIVGFTYLAIILGAFLPSLVVDELFPGNHMMLGIICVGIAILGLISAIGIKHTPATGNLERKFTPWFLFDMYKTMRRIRSDRSLFLTVIGAAYFLGLGAFIKFNLLLFGQQSLGLTQVKSGYLFPMAALGIGVGAISAGKVSGRNIEFGVVPIGATGLTLSCILLGVMPSSLTTALILIFFIGVFSGLFIVPLTSFIQFRSPKERLGEILACQNFLSFIGVILGVGIFKGLTTFCHLNADMSFIVVGVLTGILAICATYILPDFLVRFVVLLITRTFYNIKSKGVENLPSEGPALLVPNHVTWVDSLLISATQQRRIRFIMDRSIYNRRGFRHLFKLMQVIPISGRDKKEEIEASLEQASEALRQGYMVCIFAEGAVTRNGNMRMFRKGLERVAAGTDAPIIPVHIGGAWGSIFSYYRGGLLKSLPSALPYPVTIAFGEQMPNNSTAAEVRQQVLVLSSEAFDMRKSSSRTLPKLFVKTARKHWSSPAVSDTTGKNLNFGETLTASIALSKTINKLAGDDEMIGVILPASAAGALVNMATALSGKIAVNLNFTASQVAVDSAIQQCEIKTIISSRAFIEKLETLSLPEGTVYMEDIVPEITTATKIKAFLAARFLPQRILTKNTKAGPDDMATVIFSSGSTAEPKGIMLSHHNVISNIEGFRALYRLDHSDSMLGILPFFHSFGYTATLWGAMITGYEVACHPNPLDGSKIAELVRTKKLSTILATPTFLLSYIRRAKKEDFESVRAVIVGAEKLKKKTSDAFEKRFGLKPMEGYGATELSPVTALSLPDIKVDGISQTGSKLDSVGHLIPGVASRVVDPSTNEPIPPNGEGLLLIKGPNIMMGYLNNKEKTDEVIQDGWYNTGDIARVDHEGFVYLLDRITRYSKIGGEMIPHVAIEDKLTEQLDSIERVLFVSSAPDEKRGEQIIVLFTEKAGTAEDLTRMIHESDLPNLWKPRKDNYLLIDEIPTLGSGKVDQKHLKEIARTFVENRPGMIQKMINKIREAL